MPGDDKPRSFLWSPAAGNGASALLLLVAGWILGQLKWDHMLMTGVAIAAVLVAFLACRYFYARRHPDSRPLTLAELRAELKDRGVAARADVETRAGQPVLVVEVDQPQRDTDRDVRQLPRQMMEGTIGDAYNVFDGLRVRRLPDLAPMGQSLRRMVGLR